MQYTGLLIIFLSITVTSCMNGIDQTMLYYPQKIPSSHIDYINHHYANVSELRFETEPGIMLHGWFIAKDISALPTIFYYGGNAEEVSLNLDDFHNRLEANVVLFNYRGYGLSDGKPAEKALKTDALKIFRHYSDKLSLKPDNRIVMGRSLGSGIAAYIAVHDSVRKTILITPYSSIRDVAYEHFPKTLVNLLLNDHWDTMDYIGELRNPVLFLVAARDDIIPPRLAERLYEHIRAEKNMIYIERAGHNDISNHRAYWTALNTFLSR